MNVIFFVSLWMMSGLLTALYLWFFMEKASFEAIRKSINEVPLRFFICLLFGLSMVIFVIVMYIEKKSKRERFIAVNVRVWVREKDCDTAVEAIKKGVERTTSLDGVDIRGLVVKKS